MAAKFLRKTKQLFISILVSSAVLVWIGVFQLPENNLTVKVYNVGQGDSIMIKTISNYKILIDGGPDNKVLSYLGKDLAFWDRKIDLLILTHPHSDHLRGLIEVLKRYKVDQVWLTRAKNETADNQEWIETLGKLKIKIGYPKEGDLIDFGDGVRIKVLHPKKGIIDSDLNNTSIVLIVSLADFDALLTGDASKETQPFDNNLKDIEVLKVPHHGAKTALEPNFLKEIRPEVSIISVGERNNYGHPASETIKLLEDIGSKVYRTDKNGTVEVVSNGRDWYTKSER